MNSPLENALSGVNDALMAMRETPSRPRDAFSALKYAYSWLKHPSDAFEHCVKASIDECADLLRLHRPHEAQVKAADLQSEMLVRVTRQKQAVVKPTSK